MDSFVQIRVKLSEGNSLHRFEKVGYEQTKVRNSKTVIHDRQDHPYSGMFALPFQLKHPARLMGPCKLPGTHQIKPNHPDVFDSGN